MTRYTKLDAAGQPTESADYVAIRAAFFNYDTMKLEWLIWSRDVIEVDDFADAQRKASEVTLCGQVCRAPTIQELQSIVDFTRYEPAIDPIFNAPKYGWCWSSTVDAESPSGYAWFVGFANGNSLYYGRHGDGFVRAVCVSQ